MGEHVGDEQYPVFVGTVHRMLAARRPVPRAADVARRRELARRWTVHRGVHRARHAHASRSARPSACWRRAASRCATCRPCGSTTCAPAPSGAPTSSRAGTMSSRWSARRWPGCGASTSSGGSLAFEERRMGVDQILVVRARVSFATGEFLVAAAVAAGAVVVLVLLTWLVGQGARALQRDRRRLGPRLRGGGVGRVRAVGAATATTPAACWWRSSSPCGAVASPATSRGAAGARVKTRATRRCSKVTPTRPGARSASSSPRRWRSGSCRCRCRWRCSNRADRARSCTSAPRCGWSASAARASATGSSQRFRADPASRGQVMDRGPVALHPSPQLLRRRLRVVGPLPDRRAAVGRRAHRSSRRC